MAIIFIPFAVASVATHIISKKIKENLRDNSSLYLQKKNGIIYRKLSKEIFNNNFSINVQFIRENFLTKCISLFKTKKLELGTGYGRFDHNINILSDNNFITYILKKNKIIKEIIFELLSQKKHIKSIYIENSILYIDCYYDKNNLKKVEEVYIKYSEKINLLAIELAKEFKILSKNNTYNNEIKKDLKKEKTINIINNLYIALTTGIIAEFLYSLIINKNENVLLYYKSITFYVFLIIVTFSIITFFTIYYSKNSHRIYKTISKNILLGSIFSLIFPIYIFHNLNFIFDKSKEEIYEINYQVRMIRGGKSNSYYFIPISYHNLEKQNQSVYNLKNKYSITYGSYKRLLSKPEKTTYLSIKQGYFNLPYFVNIDYINPNN